MGISILVIGHRNVFLVVQGPAADTVLHEAPVAHTPGLSVGCCSLFPVS